MVCSFPCSCTHGFAQRPGVFNEEEALLNWDDASCAAMAFLIPIGVVFYAAIGGLKSTFTTSYFHTVIVYVVCCVFMFKVFLPNGLLNGIDDVRPVHALACPG